MEFRLISKEKSLSKGRKIVKFWLKFWNLGSFLRKKSLKGSENRQNLVSQRVDFQISARTYPSSPKPSAPTPPREVLTTATSLICYLSFTWTDWNFKWFNTASIWSPNPFVNRNLPLRWCVEIRRALFSCVIIMWSSYSIERMTSLFCESLVRRVTNFLETISSRGVTSRLGRKDF